MKDCKCKYLIDYPMDKECRCRDCGGRIMIKELDSLIDVVKKTKGDYEDN